jgi:diguanylate cyclase
LLTGTYNLWLVAASLLIAMLASYTALDMAGRVSATQGRSAHWWLAGGSIAMGIGIWSMHFLGMLAFSLPIPMGYDPAITTLSLLIAIASSAFALWMVCQKELSGARLCVGAALMGAGVCLMHYTGMAAMRMMPGVHYNALLFSLSCAIAVAASGAALWIAFRLRNRTSNVRRIRAGAAVVMGIAVAGMHYTGMAAAQFSQGTTCRMAETGITNGWLALLIIVSASAVLAIALVTSLLDLRLELRTAVLASSLAEANKELQFLAMHDRLTKLPNRALLEDRLEQEVLRARREGSRFSVLFLDLDGFKQVNDAFGHHTGDLLLIEIAVRIRAITRERDTLARLGGDEFVLLAGAFEPPDVARLAEKILAVVREPVFASGHECRVSASIGIALCNGGEYVEQELLRNADAAMYRAKSLGRDGYCFFEPFMNEDAQEKLQLLHDLRSAIEQNELALYYQPKVTARDGSLAGAEALLRWHHPCRGVVLPGDFIPMAEKTGLIIAVGRWVLHEACRQMSVWRDAGYADVPIAINLSPLQFNHPGLIPTVREALALYRLEPRRLILEITESTAMRDVDASMVILQQLTEMGVSISIDDFGTGYSSLLYLKRLPAAEIKIDRGFVRDLPHDKEDAAIVAAIVALGRSLNLEVVAEGVETAEQRKFLTRLGCDSLQGYSIGKPTPADLFVPDFLTQLERSIGLAS